jgi:3D (Asp-Asp-Asp) domain-containing protein
VSSIILALAPGGWPRKMLVTAYCPCTECCGPGAIGVTASGRPVSANGGRFVAADADIPFGAFLVIPGYNDGKPVEVLDRGGAIKGDHLDVFFPTHEQAKRWGAKWLVVDRARRR